MGFHGREGWYIGTALLHNRCYRIYVPETQEDLIEKTVEFPPHNGTMPAISSTNSAIDASRRLADALANLAPTVPFARFYAQTMGDI